MILIIIAYFLWILFCVAIISGFTYLIKNDGGGSRSSGGWRGSPGYKGQKTRRR